MADGIFPVATCAGASRKGERARSSSALVPIEERRKIRVSIYRFLRLSQVFNLFNRSISTLPVSNYGKYVVPTVPQERTPGGLGGLATVRSGARHCRTALGPADSSRRSTSSESGTGDSGGLGRGLVFVRPRVCSIPFEPKIGEALTLGRAGREIG